MLAIWIAGARSPTLAAEAGGLQSLHYLTEDYAPSNFIENGKLTGYAVDFLHALWRWLGVADQPIQVVPWARGYQMALSEPMTVLFAMARTPEREALFKWAGPIYQTEYQLVGIKSKQDKVAALADVLSRRVGAIRGDQGQALLEKAGVPAGRLTLATDARTLMRMLKAGRIEGIALTSGGAIKAAAAEGLGDDDLSVFGSLSKIGVYFAFHRDTPTATVEAIQTAINALDAERRRILATYQLGT